MEKEMKKVPAVRFKGFTGDWEQRKLGEIADKVTSKNKEQKYKETLTNSAEQGIVSQKEYFDHSISNIENINGYYVVEDNDFVYNPRISTSAPVGPINRNKLGRTGVMSPLYTVFKPHEIDESYLEWFFKSSHWYKFMYLNGDTGARSDRFAIKDSVFFKMPIPVPIFEEQYKVGNFLNEADRLLTLHQQKLDQLKKLKAYFLQNLFPAKGEKVPKIRFKGFTGEWEQSKLGNVLIERSILRKQSDEFPLVSFTVKNGVTPKTERYEREQLVVGDKKEKSYKETRLNDIVYNPANLKFGAIARNKYGNAVFSPIYVTYDVREEMALPSFVERFVTRESFIKNALRYQQGTVYERMAVSPNDFETLDILVPTKDEQKKIGDVFDNLDTLITLYQYNLECFQAVKKFLLQNLFV